VTIRVFLVEDLPAMRALLIDLFTSIGNFQVVGTSTTEAEANLWLQEFPTKWDLAIVDLILAEGSGLGVVPRARSLRPDADIVVLSAFASPGIQRHLVANGVKAVFDKADTTAFIEWLDKYASESRQPPAPG
jgi:two-component system, OmpR family, response regulator